MMKWIRFLINVGEHKKDSFLEVDAAVADAHVRAGNAVIDEDGPTTFLLRQAQEEYRQGLRTLTRSVTEEIRASTAEMARPGAGRIEVGESEADRTRGLGDLVRQVVFASDPRNADRQAAAIERLDKVYGSRYQSGEQRGQAESQGSTGGFLTGANYEAMLLEVAAEQSVLAGRAKAVALGARTTYWPALDQFKVPTPGQSAFFGGVQVSRKGENVQRGYTQAGFKMIGLTAQDMTALVPISRDDIFDSLLPIDGKVAELIGGAIGWREDWEAFNGTGAGQMLGIYNAPSSILLARTTGGTVKYQDVFAMRSRMLSQGKKNAVWVIHPYMMPVLEQIQDPSGRFIMRPYFLGDNRAALSEAPIYQMEGIPIVETEKAPLPGTTGDLTLTDPSSYLLGRRGGLEISVSDQFLFDTDQIAIRAKLRNDGQPQLLRAITLADGTATVSTTVILQ
jgi:HK97 family phage major capsid protein